MVVLLSATLAPGGGPISGWTAYPPLSAVANAGPGQGMGMDLWLASLTLFSIATTLASVNTLTTVIRMRCDGMTWERLPLTVWGWFTAALLSLLAFSVLLAALLLLFCDRHAGTSFFVPAGGPGEWRAARCDAWAGEWIATVVAASVLVLRTSGGLYRDPTGDGADVHGAGKLCAATDHKLSRDDCDDRC